MAGRTPCQGTEETGAAAGHPDLLRRDARHRDTAGAFGTVHSGTAVARWGGGGAPGLVKRADRTTCGADARNTRVGGARSTSRRSPRGPTCTRSATKGIWSRSTLAAGQGPCPQNRESAQRPGSFMAGGDERRGGTMIRQSLRGRRWPRAGPARLVAPGLAEGPTTRITVRPSHIFFFPPPPRTNAFTGRRSGHCGQGRLFIRR